MQVQELGLKIHGRVARFESVRANSARRGPSKREFKSPGSSEALRPIVARDVHG